MRRRKAQWHANRAKVLMAVYWLAEPGGRYTLARSRAIAEQTGLSEKVVSQHLQEMQRDRTLLMMCHPSFPARLVFLNDSPEGRDALDRFRAVCGPDLANIRYAFDKWTLWLDEEPYAGNL